MLGHRKLAIEDYLAIWKRRRGLVLLCAILFPILAVAVTFFLKPKFVSQTLVLVDDQKVPDEYVKAIVSSNLDAELATMKEQILSRSQLQPIIQQYDLYGGKDHLSMDDRIAKVRKDVVITPIKPTTSKAGALPGFYIAFSSSNPRTAQDVCGDITSLFVSENAHTRENSAAGTTAFLEKQLKDAKASLDEQDAKLAAFQRKYGGTLPSEASSNMNMLTSMNARLEAATQAVGQLEQNLTYQQSMLAQEVQAETPAAAEPSSSGGAVATTVVGTPAQQAQMQSLISQENDLTTHYTADYPDVIAVKRKIAELRSEMAPMTVRTVGGKAVPAAPVESGVVRQLRAQVRASEIAIDQKRKEQEQIQAQSGMYESRIQATPQVEEEYKSITRDYDTANKFYDDLLSKLNRSKMATDLELTQEGQQFRVMDKPNLPDAPTFPNRLLFAAGGFIFGAGFGIALSAWFEYRDTAFRSERDVWAFTRLPTLATISVAGEIEPAEKNARSWFRRRQAKPAADAENRFAGSAA